MLFSPFDLRGVQLANRAVMAPLTRQRALEHNTPNSMMASYYAQRASAGLIITEGTSPSPNGLGYARMPGLFNAAQRDGWKLVTDAVHRQGGKIVLQIMHTGRVSHLANMPAGAEVWGPSAESCPGEMRTDTQGSQPHTPPRAMTAADIAKLIEEHVQTARLAMAAGFDGIELHGANGYLIEQFLNPHVNRRTDGYGGDIAGRNRLLLEIAQASAQEIGAERVGVRLSPYGVVNATAAFDEVDQQYLALVQQLSSLGLLYLHVLDHSASGTPPVPEATKSALRAAFEGPFILTGGFDKASAEQALRDGRADLIAMGRPFLANPDLVERMRRDAPLNPMDPATLYAGGAQGYTDYPALAA
ncbi:alkene reductase [Duganella sp. sic0402]|uniref:alkene reductase n=1 Tax=Duganella sp. sic0402 TaxID=2854786 RepID=UPI001C482F61|nr:alkene reductase [Duganella sp. sic0402]MBV7534143.1 alkene reductase [Duganella sp. sic0402]